jgi:hypothetical protein
MDQMLILVNNNLSVISKDIGPFVRFVDKSNMSWRVGRKHVITKLKNGKPFYLFTGDGKIFIDYNKIQEDTEAFQKISKIDHMIA